MAWPAAPSKTDLLPVDRTELGYVQRASWQHEDRLHEEILELDSPYIDKVPAGTQVDRAKVGLRVFLCNSLRRGSGIHVSSCWRPERGQVDVFACIFTLDRQQFSVAHVSATRRQREFRQHALSRTRLFRFWR